MTVVVGSLTFGCLQHVAQIRTEKKIIDAEETDVWHCTSTRAVAHEFCESFALPYAEQSFQSLLYFL